jgi:D-xylose transport system permease protein
MNGDAQAAVTNTPEAPRAPEEPVRGLVGAQIHRILGDIRAGEFGSWPIIIALIIISAFFYSKNSLFLSGSNLITVIEQVAPLATLAIGVTFVLLIAEIDLSVAYLSALTGSVLVAELSTRHAHLSGLVVIPIAIAAGALFGMVQGMSVAYLRVPSFVVTLAGMLVAEGIVLKAIGSVPIYLNDKWILDLELYTFTRSLSWVIAAIVSVLYALAVLNALFGRHRQKVAAGSLWFSLLKVVAVSGAMFGVVAWVNRARGGRGLPLALVIVLVLIAFWTFIANRTTFGRHVYAVGGNAEAARRAGINVPRIKILVFMIAGIMATISGAMDASRHVSAYPLAGSDPLLMYAIAAAVIGGTSLFGGRGQVKGALLGALVIMMIDNGCDLLGYSSSTRFIATALILLAAVTMDTIARRRQAAAGR